MTKSVSKSDYGFYMQRTWEVQKPPYISPLPFVFAKGWRTYWAGEFPGSQNFGPDRGTGYNNHIANVAYEHLVNQLGDSSQMANNLIEANQSIDMISGAANTLAKLAVSVAKKDVRGVINALGIRGNVSKSSRASRIVRGTKSLGNKWLELHFGWVPLAQDMHNAVQTLTSKPDMGEKGYHASRSDHFHEVNGSLFSPPSQPAWFGGDQQTTNVSFHYTLRSNVKLLNPNFRTANQLGVVNPLSVLWEAVPYSFVVDWFSNVGQVLSSCTDFIGLSVTHSSNTLFQQGTSERKSYLVGSPFDYDNSSSGESVFCNRAIGIPGPQLEIKPLKGLSVSRGATAISLLLQKLPRY